MKPWREIAVPHKDVLKGTLKQSEFAADITQVANGTAVPEYQDAKKFFARTYITEGMRHLLISVAQRLAGQDGDPVIQLQTNFGGGKTHTLLAVYHLAQHTGPADKLSGIPPLLEEAGIKRLPAAKVAVIDGINLSPNQPRKEGRLKINTVWGQIAYQLLGAEGYAMVADSDKTGVAPGKSVLAALLEKAAPCVLLLDELVAFYRQLDGRERLTAGSWESNMSFIQALTESVKMVKNAVLLASLPESKTEAVGSFGENVLVTLEKYFGRVESVWKPVAVDESFEIVRRRLFESNGDEKEVKKICEAFSRYYKENKDKFPPEVQGGAYGERLKKSYPIHPEVFDRLYEDWSTLDKFQRTRGVLQYMAVVINRLYKAENNDPLIMPGSLPLADGNVRIKSTHYLPQGWDPIIEKEIDGDGSEPEEIDKDPNFGKYSAAHRAARTIFLGTAPSNAAQGQRGITAERILLGCALPGQTLSTYEDVLKRLRDKLHYLFAGVDRLWFDTRPNLRREMESRKGKVENSLLRRTLKEAASKAAGQGKLFAGVHVFTPHADIPDEIGAGPRLVLLPPELANAYCSNDKKAFRAAEAILASRGEQPRMRRNRLFFLAPDLNSYSRVVEQGRIYLAWKEIVGDIDAMHLVLDTLQVQQAKKECEAAQKILEQAVRECYRFLLIPAQKGADKVDFTVRKIGTSNSNIAASAEKDLLENQEIVTNWSPVFLKKILKEHYFKDGQTEVSAQKVWQDFCTYYFLPRLLNENVFKQAIVAGISKGDYFGFADGKEGGKYLGFEYGSEIYGLALGINEESLLIENKAAAKYKQEHAPAAPAVSGVKDDTGGGNKPTPDDGDNTPPDDTVVPPVKPGVKTPQYQRFFGTVKLNPVLGENDFHRVVEELVSHFTAKPGVNVTIKLDIEAAAETPFDGNTVRIVTENSKALQFETAEFGE